MFDFWKMDPPRRGTASAAGVEAQFKDCADFEKRSVTAGRWGIPATACWLDGCVSGDQVSEDILRPLNRLSCARAGECIELAVAGGVYSATVRERTTDEEIVSDLTGGFAAVIFDETGSALTFEVKPGTNRSVEMPTVEKSVLGAKDAFVETLRTNTSLVRRRLSTPALKLWQTDVGSETKTKVDVLYLDGTARPEQVDAVKARLEKLDIRSLTAAGDLERPLAGTPRTVFPQVLHTERPDRFVLGLLRGKVGILADGLPVGFLLPGTLPEMMRTQEDRARHAAVAISLVLLRWAALVMSLLLPAVYVAVAMYHQEMIPYKLLLSAIQAKEAVPFSTAVEVLGMLLSFELLQEAGIRLPEPVGQTVSVIGALIVGQSAVEAKVLSPIVIIIVAMAGIGSYTQPSQELGAAIRLWRLGLVFCAMLLGLFGVMAGLMLMLWRLCDMENLGVSYLYPLCDGRPGAARRSVIRPPVGEEDAP